MFSFSLLRFPISALQNNLISEFANSADLFYECALF